MAAASEPPGPCGFRARGQENMVLVQPAGHLGEEVAFHVDLEWRDLTRHGVEQPMARSGIGIQPGEQDALADRRPPSPVRVCQGGILRGGKLQDRFSPTIGRRAHDADALRVPVEKELTVG